MAPRWRRISDGALFEDGARRTGKPADYEELRPDGNPVNMRLPPATLITPQHRQPSRDATTRPHPRNLSRVQLLADVARALHEVMPDRVDDLVRNIERRMHDKIVIGFVGNGRPVVVLEYGPAGWSVREEERFTLRTTDNATLTIWLNQEEEG